MLSEFSARAVGLEVLDHLERRRPGIVGDEGQIREEIHKALVPVRTVYREYDLPASYLAALEEELLATLPARWRAIAGPFTEAEKSGFRTWRRGDPIARLSYVFTGLIVGGFCVWAPFIPIWEKWFPFLLAIAAWWLPDLQARFYRRRYARELGQIVLTLERAQNQLDRHITAAELMPPPEKET